jgi:hypothetical protein
MRPVILFVILAIIIVFAEGALAVTEDVLVTPAYLKDKPEEFSISTEKHEDGLIHFTITHYLFEPRYLVARFIVRDKGSVVLDGSFPSFVREKRVKYYLAVSPKQLPNAHFELSEHGFNVADETPLPWVGGTDYQFHLADFAPKASKTSGN